MDLHPFDALGQLFDVDVAASCGVPKGGDGLTLVPAFSARSAISAPVVAVIFAAVSNPANIPAGEEAKLAIAPSGPGSSPP